MMNESSSCLAITEKKPHPRPGGCVGIFFQLFDWNRRLAKKKLFSKKLLAPVRAKQASKKFLGNDKLSTPKLHLIDDENRGGFPNARRNVVHGVAVEGKQDMPAPSLVARLMGLESMPPARKNKPEKSIGSGIGDDSEEHYVGSDTGYDWEDENSDMGLVKHEMRPPKHQKTGQFDRRAVTRFGSEALHFKNVLSRSRKHNSHPKLVSPVKSPRVGKNASRWIDAATRILEPGLQATNRAKCALTYSNSSHYSTKDKGMIEGITVLSPNIPKQTCYRDNNMDSFVGQSSCHNCNHDYSDVLKHQSNVEEYPSVFGLSVSSYVNPSSREPVMCKPRPPKSLLEQEREEDFQSRLQAAYHISKAREGRKSHNEPCRDNKPLTRDSQERWHFTSQPRKPLKDERTPVVLKHMTRTPSQMSMGREIIGTRSKASNLNSRRVSSAVTGVSGAKDFVALNRNLSGRTRSRIPIRVDKSKLEADSYSCSRQDDSFLHLRSPIRKRRSINVAEQAKTSKFPMQDFGSQDNSMYDASIPTGGRQGARFTKQSYATSKLAHGERDHKGNRNQNDNVISIEFSSPMKKKIIASSIEIEKQGEDIEDSFSNAVSEHKKLIADANDRIPYFQNQTPIIGDALGALLIQKLKELSCQEEDELGTGGSQPKRTTAVILQELISALTAEQPFSQNDGASRIDSNGDSYYCQQDLHDDLFEDYNGEEPPQPRTKIQGTMPRFTHDGNHFSPGSVLEASFSTESCISSSLDDNSGHQMHVHELMNCSCLPQKLQPEAEISDSAISFDKASTKSETTTDVINFVSKILQTINLSGIQLSGSKLSYVKEVLLSSELLFSTTVSHTENKFSIGSFLLNELETLAAALWANSNWLLLGLEDAKDENPLREFLFDCVIEYLDTTYAKYCKSGFKTFTRLMPCMNTMLLIHGISNEVKSWTDLAQKNPDEIIELEMSRGLGKWTDFDIEAFETGVEIDVDILQIMVDDIVSDLYESRPRLF